MAHSDTAATREPASDSAGVMRPPRRWRLLLLGGRATTLVREWRRDELAAMTRGRRSASEQSQPPAPAP
jgi:hypothetical protein